MKLQKTAKIKLDLMVEDILPTIQAYTSAYNFICQIGYSKKIYNPIELHHLCYQKIRENFNLPSQLAISSRTKASESLKSILSYKAEKAIKKAKKRSKNKKKKLLPAKCPQSKLMSIRLDCHSYSLFLEKGIISLLTISGRQKFNLKIPKYYAEYFSSWRYTSADLIITKKNKVFINITFEKEINDSFPSDKYLGIDRGINNIAVTSDNIFFKGGKVKQQVRKYQKLRKKLQAKGTRSAKRHLKKLSGKERRFRADINHQISKKIVSTLNSGDHIVLENLKGIRSSKTANLERNRRKLINSWNFAQLEEFLTYKGKEKGISVVYVSPIYTSQRCSKCGHIHKENRNKSKFECKECSFKLDADLNAARNISLKYLDSKGYPDLASVNKPNGIAESNPTNVLVEILDTNSQFSG